jgi:Flp pilus assembly protein TadG
MSGLVARMRRHFRQRTLGQSFVEFALILPVFLLFLAATLDLGRVFYANITLNSAAREGAFQAAKTPDQYLSGQACNEPTNKVVCRVQEESAGSMIAIKPADIQMTCNPGSCPKAPGATTTVVVRGKFQLLTPILSFVFGGQTLNLTSSATAQIEYLPQISLITPPPPPVAAFTGTPRTGNKPLTVSFNSSASTGNPSGFQWDFDGDGIVDSTDPNPTYTYTSAGTYTVTLTVVNLTGVDVEQKVGYIVVSAPPTPTPTGGPTPTPTATPAPTPSCVYPPDVIGMTPSNSAIAFQNAGFNNVTQYGDLTKGNKGKIQAQNPDHTQCVALTTAFITHYRPN